MRATTPSLSEVEAGQIHHAHRGTAQPGLGTPPLTRARRGGRGSLHPQISATSTHLVTNLPGIYSTDQSSHHGTAHTTAPLQPSYLQRGRNCTAAPAWERKALDGIFPAINKHILHFISVSSLVGWSGDPTRARGPGEAAPNGADPGVTAPCCAGREGRDAGTRVQPWWPEDSSAKEGFRCSELHKQLLHLGGDGGKDRKRNVDTLGQAPQKPPALARRGPR